MMRVAYVSMDSGVPVFGSKGCSIHVQEIIRALTKLGTRVDLFTTRVGGQAPSDLCSVRVHYLPSPAHVDVSKSELCALSLNEQIEKMLKRSGPFDLIYERYSLWSCQAMEFCRAHGIPGVLEVNAPLIEEQSIHRGLVNRWQAETVARRAFYAAPTLVAVSAEVARYLDGFPPSRGRIHVIPNGVNTDRFPQGLTATFEPERTTFTVGFVGTLKPWHGTAVLVEAFELLHKQRGRTCLLIVGDGPERQKLQEQVKRRGLTDVTHLTGRVHPHEIPPLLASMNVGVAPYDDADGFYFSPLKVYEYMAAGLPTVASRVGQLADLITDNETGLLCAPGDAGLLAAALSRLQDDPALATRLGTAARLCVERDHTWDVTMRRILDVAGLEARCQLSRTEAAA